MEAPNYMQMPGVARSLGASVSTFRLRQEDGWEPDWDEFERAVRPGTRLPLPVESEQSHWRRPLRRRDAAHRRSVRADGDVDPRRRGVSRRRDRSAAHAQLLGDGRSRDRDERAVEGIRHSRRPDRLDRGAARGRRRLLVAARLPDDRPEQAVGSARADRRRAGEPRALLRANADDPSAEPADRARLDRRLRRTPDVARTAGGCDRAAEVRRGRPEPRDRRAGSRFARAR